MTQTQILHLQLDNYGPWTTTPEPRQEADLQALQSRLYADVAQQIGAAGGYAFFGRFDNIVAVTNGLDRRDHVRLQESLGNRYPVSVSMAIAAATDPATALSQASERLQAAGSAQDGDRTGVFRGEPLATAPRDDDVEVAHFDINDVTGRFTDRTGEFATLLVVQRCYIELMAYLYHTEDALTFFVGGDNFVALCPSLSADAYEAAIDHVAAETGVELKVGVDTGATALTAGMGAKHALERCREEDSTVCYTPRPVARGQSDD